MKKSIKKLGLLGGSIMLLMSLMLAGCSAGSTAASSSAQTEGKKLSVVTSFYPMYDFTKKIGGDYVDVKNLVPAGSEPHDWEPSTADITGLEKADVLVYNGAGMESWVKNVLSSLKNKDLFVVEASKNVQLRRIDNNKDKKDTTANQEEGTYDPHVWLNPMNAKIEMENIKNKLVEADPAHKEYYENNYKTYSAQCDKLNDEYKQVLSKVKDKNLVVSHEAFGYLCDQYGLNQIGIQGINPDVEPDPAHMANIIKYVKDNNVHYIFSEDLVSPKVAQTIADATGAKMQVLNPIEGLNDKQLANGDDYFSVMRQNLDLLKTALN